MLWLPYDGKKVRLRRLSLADLATFQAYRSDPEIRRYQGWFTKSPELATAFLAEMASTNSLVIDKWFQLAIADPSSDVLLGDIGILLKQQDGLNAEVGISLSRQAQGRGLAAEAYLATLNLLFRHTAVERIEGIADTRNEPSIRLLKRVGMHLERTITGTFRGEPCTEHVFCLSRKEWANEPGRP